LGFLQITRTTPLRLMMRQLLQIRFTDALTFMLSFSHVRGVRPGLLF
jgi:hypothetical protein